MADRDQLSLAEALVSQKVGRNTALERLAREVDWQPFERLLLGLRSDGPGRPAYDGLLMLKALLLQRWYDLSDAELEEAINDRVSFRRFLGLSLEDAAPDHTTLCRFRNRLVDAGLSEALFEAFTGQLEARGLILKRGTMIDASLIATPQRPPAKGADATTAADPDAATTARKGRQGTHYGYKAHLGVDEGSRLIRSRLLTPANVNDTTPADALVSGDERAVWADKGYAKRARREALRRLGIKPRIMHKTWGGGPPLTSWQRRHNALIAPVRAAVEGVFATLKRWLGFATVRYRGLAKCQAELSMVALAYNMRRSLKLAA